MVCIFLAAAKRVAGSNSSGVLVTDVVSQHAFEPDYFFTMMVWLLVYSERPSSEFSTPMPDCL